MLHMRYLKDGPQPFSLFIIPFWLICLVFFLNIAVSILHRVFMPSCCMCFCNQHGINSCNKPACAWSRQKKQNPCIRLDGANILPMFLLVLFC